MKSSATCMDSGAMVSHPIQVPLFHGVVSVERGDGWLRPWRIPFANRALFDAGLVERASCTAGVRVRFRTEATAVGLEIVPDAAEPSVFDGVVDNRLVSSVQIAAGADTVCFSGLPDGDKIVEIWLPCNRSVAVRGILAESGCAVAPARDDRFRWVTYGSSITMCRSAHSPARTWPGIVARERNWNLTCLGYGGQCHLETLVARMISELPADFISLKLGINVCGASSMSMRTFRSAVIGMVALIRERHPRTPMLLISPIINPPRETVPNAAGLSLSLMRSEIAEAHRRLVEAGDVHLSYADGLVLFGPDLVGPRLPDDLHPDGDGYEQMGLNVIEKVLPHVAGVPVM